jgi:hypothetical protein
VTVADPISCLTPNCGRIATQRGLCETCYARLKARVRAGQTTWADLEARGLALPARGRGWADLRRRRKGKK